MPHPEQVAGIGSGGSACTPSGAYLIVLVILFTAKIT
jgi:hypothetical protein